MEAFDLLMIIRKLISAVITTILFGTLLRILLINAEIIQSDVPIWGLMWYSGIVNFSLAVPSSIIIELIVNKLLQRFNLAYAAAYAVLHALVALVPFWYMFNQAQLGEENLIIIGTLFTLFVFCLSDLLIKKYTLSLEH